MFNGFNGCCRCKEREIDSKEEEETHVGLSLSWQELNLRLECVAVQQGGSAEGSGRVGESVFTRFIVFLLLALLLRSISPYQVLVPGTCFFVVKSQVLVLLLVFECVARQIYFEFELTLPDFHLTTVFFAVASKVDA